MYELTKSEENVLRECEVIIQKGLSSFFDVGNALLKIRDEKLYRQEFKTFEQYCQNKWQIQRAYAYRLMEASEVVSNLSPIGDKLPTTETQVRPLTTLDPQDQIKVWQEVLDVKPDGKVTAKFVEKFVDNFKHEKKMASIEKFVGAPDLKNSQLFVHDIREHIEFDENLDAVITDPPYPEEYLPLWSDLAKFARSHLKEGGVLLAMTPHIWLPQIMTMLGEHLDYQWIISNRMIGTHASSIARQVANIMWKPILVYRNGGDMLKIGSDEFASPKTDKDFHEWGQSVGGYLWQIEQFTNPGDLICDPFLGGGTTAVAAKQLNRRFIGFDVNPDNVTITKARLHESI